MKFFLSLSLLTIILTSFLTEKEVQYLKKNAPYEVYDLTENPFKDWSEDQIRNLFIPISEDVNEEEKENKKYIPSNDLPESFDGRVEWPDCIQPILNLNYNNLKFIATSAFSQRICKKSKGIKKVVLSVQQIINCNHNIYYIDEVWRYFEDPGVVDEHCFPYDTTSQECLTKCKNGAAWIPYKAKNSKSFSNIDEIKKELYENGYVNSGFTVYSDFMNYRGGIYEHKTGYLLGGHEVNIVGWGVENGVHYWIVQNTWGEKWGENGFFRIKFGQCGIDSRGYAGVPA